MKTKKDRIKKPFLVRTHTHIGKDVYVQLYILEAYNFNDAKNKAYNNAEQQHTKKRKVIIDRIFSLTKQEVDLLQRVQS